MEDVFLILIIASLGIISYLAFRTKTVRSFQFEMFLFMLVLAVAEAPRILETLGVVTGGPLRPCRARGPQRLDGLPCRLRRAQGLPVLKGERAVSEGPRGRPQDATFEKFLSGAVNEARARSFDASTEVGQLLPR